MSILRADEQVRDLFAETTSSIALAADPLTVANEEILSLQAMLEAAKVGRASAVEMARKSGIEEGLKLATAAERTRDERVENCCREALAAWRQRLDTLEPAASLLAREAIGKVFGDHPLARDLVAASIKVRVERLAVESLIQVRVNSDDFSNDDLARMSEDIRSAVTIDRSLRAGECVIDLRLGRIVVSAAEQWKHLRTFFDAQVPA